MNELGGAEGDNAIDEGGAENEACSSTRKRKAYDPKAHRTRSSFAPKQIAENVQAIYGATNELKLTGPGSCPGVWQATVADMLSREGLDDLISLDPEGPLYKSHVRPMVEEVVRRIEVVYKDPKRWSLWMARWGVADLAIEDFKHTFCDVVPPCFLEGGPLHEVFKSEADGRKTDNNFFTPRMIDGLPNIKVPRCPSKRAVVAVRDGVAVNMDGTQTGNGKGNDTYSTGVEYLLEKTAKQVHNTLSTIFVGTAMTTMVMLGFYQDAAKLFKRTPDRAQTTTGMRNIKNSHSPWDFVMFSMSLNGEATWDVYKGMDNSREYCQRKTTLTVKEGWDALFGPAGTEYPVCYGWGGDHCNLMSQAGLVHGTNDVHYRCPCCIAQQKDFMDADLNKKWSSEEVRRTPEKQRMWAHAVEGLCTKCGKTVTKKDVMHRTGADDRMTHAQRLKHASEHYGVLPGHAPLLDGELGQVNADLVSDIMHAGTNIVSFLIIQTLFAHLPAPVNAKKKSAREQMVIKLKEAVDHLPINLYNFGIRDKTNETCTPSPTGPEAYTLIFCFPALIDIVHPKNTLLKRQVTACWEALLAMYIVHWDPTVGDTLDDRIAYRDALRLTAHNLMQAVITACGTSSSCVYFHICLWHLPSAGYKYGSLAQFCTEAIEGNNAKLKRINTNGQKLAAPGGKAPAGKRQKCSKSVPMQIMRTKELVAVLSEEFPLRVRMRKAMVVMNSGWRNALSYDGWKDLDADTKPTTVNALSMIPL